MARLLRLKVDERGEVPQCVCEQAMRGVRNEPP